MTEDELRTYARNAAATRGYPMMLFERQINQESGFNPDAGSDEGAVGIAQIVPKWHPDVDAHDPIASLDYAAEWMARLLKQYGDIVRPLVVYNGGTGALERWHSGRPIDESVRYVDAIVGDSTLDQFGPELASIYVHDWVVSMCGPIAIHGAARLLGRDIGIDTVMDRVVNAPGPLWAPEYGMAGSSAFCDALVLFDMRGEFMPLGDIDGALWGGRPVAISTPKHYYLAQRRPSRTDDDVFVGHTGLARINGAEWMNPATIAERDGGATAIVISPAA